MRLLKYAFLISLLLFAWSVCVFMINISADAEMSIMGISANYFMLPLLVCNICIMAVNGFWLPRGGISSVILVWLIIVSIITAINSTNLVLDIIQVTLWPTTYFASYLLCSSDPSFSKDIKKTFVAIFIMGVGYFIMGKEIQISMLRSGYIASANSVFCVLTVLPFLLLLKNRSFSLAAIVVTFLCVLFSNKRSATLAFAIALIPTLLAYLNGIKSKVRRVILVILICVGCLMAFFYINSTYLEGNIFLRYQSIEDDGGSGRVDIWAYVMNAFQNSDFFSKFFGHGHYAVSGLGSATAAHNDFLEVLYDYGIIAFIIYLLLHRSIIKKVLLLRRQQSPFFASYFFFAIIFIVMSWVSILIPQQRYIIYMAILMAYTEVETEKVID